jgi:predicted NAD/FAD-dependent oxidoreductase
VTVVGGGIAGLACARALSSAGVAVRVVDRGHRVGGRMASRAMRGGRVVDIGASYLTASDGSAFAGVVADWVDRGLATPWTDTFAVAGPGGIERTTTGPLRYGAPGGLRSLVADLAADVPVRHERTVEQVRRGPTVDGEPVAAAVLAMPDPQARRLLDPATADRLLGDRPWEPALAVVLGYQRRSWPADLHGVFVSGDEAVSWIADDGDRRGDGAPVLVAHTPPGMARAHLADPDAATPAVTAAVARVLGLELAPDWTTVHRWTFARPTDPRPEPYGLVDGIGACGDGWAAPSRVEAAWTSGTELGRALARSA